MLPPFSFKYGIAYLTVAKVPRRLMFMVWSQDSISMVSMGVIAPLIPALAKTMSSLPHFSAACFTAASTCCGSAMSHSMTTASPPSSSTCLRTFSAFSTVRSSIATFAPLRAKASTDARPMPDPPPLTIATLPSNFLSAMLEVPPYSYYAFKLSCFPNLYLAYQDVNRQHG
ncbi:hypothetical protein D3C73_788730 [compost metagenome]